MPLLSDRITGLLGGAGDDGWSVYIRAREMEAEGRPVIFLAVGDHDIHTDASILAAMREAQDRGNLGYPPVPGSRALRAEIAARVTARTATPATGAEVLVTPGGQAALFAALMTALDPGSTCIVLDPYYATYAQTVRAAGGEPVMVPTRAEDGFQPDPAAIAAAIRPSTRAILVNTPNNPTGAVYTRDRLEAIAALCRDRDLWLISDEVYDGQVHEGAHLSPRDLPGMAERTLVVQSLSKSHAMTGSRLGWLLGPAEAVGHAVDLATSTTYGVPGFIQDAGLHALRHGAAIEAEIGARYRRRRDAALAALGNGGVVRAVAPQAGMYLMLDIRETGLSGEDFAHRLLAEELVAVMPGESFGRATAGHLRVALVRPEEVLADALSRIARFAGRVRAPV